MRFSENTHVGGHHSVGYNKRKRERQLSLGESDEGEVSEPPGSPTSSTMSMNGDRAFVEHDDVEEVGHHIVEAQDIIEQMGVSGFILVAQGKKGLLQCMMIAAQALTIQVVILYHVWKNLKKYEEREDADERTVNRWIIMCCNYLHVLNCCKDVPFSFQAFACFHHLHEDWLERFLAYPIFVADSFIIPFATMIFGALYICTSLTSHDAILNSCGLVFINDIDNFIVHVNTQMRFMQGLKRDGRVGVPLHDSVFASLTLYAVSYFPIIPALVSWGLTSYAYDTLEL